MKRSRGKIFRIIILSGRIIIRTITGTIKTSRIIIRIITGIIIRIITALSIIRTGIITIPIITTPTTIIISSRNNYKFKK